MQKDLDEKLAEIERRRLVSNWNKFLDFVSKTVCMVITEPCSLWFSIVICLLSFFFFKEGKLSYEEAILARQTMIKENQQRVMEMKEEVRGKWLKVGI